MNLYYYRDKIGNFGDDLNGWLWPKLFPTPLENCLDDETLFLGIGSILNHKVPGSPIKKLVFGSGFGYGAPPVINSDWYFYCVRGPLTARMLGLPTTLGICDGAVLVRKLITPAPQSGARVAFMPHHVTARYDDWRAVCDALQIDYIDPAAPVHETLTTIRTSSLVITEAMHGAIVADALRVPWIPVCTRPHIATFKWQDWSASLEMEHSFEWLPRISRPDAPSQVRRFAHPIAASFAQTRLRWLIRYAPRRLSRDAVFERVYRRLCAAFDRMVWATAADGRMYAPSLEPAYEQL